MAHEIPAPERFVTRHVGPSEDDVGAMVRELGYPDLDRFVEAVVPSAIRLGRSLDLPPAKGEFELLQELEEIASANRVLRSYIGMGYSDCVTPPVVLRNVLQNPAWYTAYTPYQAEISQGRLEALLNFQTAVADLTGLQVSNASLLDEGTAAAEAMAMAHRLRGKGDGEVFFVADNCHPQTIEVVRTRARPVGIEVVVGEPSPGALPEGVFGVLVQYPASDGEVGDHRDLVAAAHARGAKVVFAVDLLALTLLTPPGELGADICVGSAQRFGVPMGYGGPHAAFLSARAEHIRTMPGRIIGVSRDARGQPALRMTLQTREQHIRREKATSNVCTAQVLLAVVAGLYAVWHGPDGLRRIARRVHGHARTLSRGLTALGFTPRHTAFFDTLRLDVGSPNADALMAEAESRGMNFRRIDAGSLGISLDETTTEADVEALLGVFESVTGQRIGASPPADDGAGLPAPLRRTSPFLEHPVFHRHRSETAMLRYVKSLEAKDFSLVHGMIPLGSCTMKLNATSEMSPITWPAFARMHPFAPPSQAEGYRRMFRQLEAMLAEITGFAGISLQPNAGSQGELAGMLVIRGYHESRGEGHRDVCLIPSSAHGTNPASAVMAGYRVVVVRCDEAGNIDLDDLQARAEQHRERLAALMVTYPSTHGVFEEEIRAICDVVHRAGGQVYMDGANMNAQVGLCRPGDIGADVCHLNLHKTFAIPHGGGGPGVGPIGVAPHLVPFLPGHPVVPTGGSRAVGPVSAAPWGSSSVLPISWVYIRLLGPDGLRRATEVAILNANYVAHRLEGHYPVLYRGHRGLVAHECILDTRSLKASAGIEAEDIAKRLMDYGFHAPTMSFPVAGTLMVEPTESEPREELDRFVEAMIGIREEIRAIEEGRASREDNPLKNAPHTAEAVTADAWTHPYPRQAAAFPTAATRRGKFWPAVSRLDNVYGDRHPVCTCPPVQDYDGME
ncbi:aminomethyl-transferring glycine dehydrogenase [Myxococcota bacterium]|nr:aminomethyl-transferring glycine dehydrogenase [Myxococcota bacterium]